MEVGEFWNANYGHFLDLHSEKLLSCTCLFCTLFWTYVIFHNKNIFLKDRLNLGPTNSIPMYTVKRGWTHIHDMNKNVHGSMVYNSFSILPKDLKLPKTDKNLSCGLRFLN